MDRDVALALVDALGDIKDVLDDILEVLTPTTEPAEENPGT